MATTTVMKFSLPKIGTGSKAAPAKQTVKKAVSKVGTVKKPVQTVKKAISKVGGTASTRLGGAGYRKYEGEALWLPNTSRPAWLDGSLPGDRGFDPLGLAKPVEYLQYDVDSLDQNKAVNKPGGVVGSFSPKVDQVSDSALSPYSEVFGLLRFRENEVIHGRWAMLACLGAVVAEGVTGVSWVDAGKVELDGAQYFNLPLPFSITQLVWIEALAVGGAEIYRNGEKDPEKRVYPGGYFDPLRLAQEDPVRARKLKEAEIKHGRLAMVSFLGYSVQAFATGEGALGSLALFAKNLSRAATS